MGEVVSRHLKKATAEPLTPEETTSLTGDECNYNFLNQQIPFLRILGDKYYYTEDYEEITLSSGNCVLTPFYNKKAYNGKINEEEFIQFIDPIQNIKWWFKNGDYGRECLAFKYFNEEERKDSLFYPDWLIQMKDGRIGIFDTKGGITANQISTKNKAEALAKRIKEMNDLAGTNIFFGGIIIKENGLWYYNDLKAYQTFKENSKDWKLLSEILNSSADNIRVGK